MAKQLVTMYFLGTRYWPRSKGHLVHAGGMCWLSAHPSLFSVRTWSPCGFPHLPELWDKARLQGLKEGFRQ